MGQILNKDIEYLLSEYDLSDDAISFLIAGLQRDPKSRYSCRQLLDHEWLREDQLPMNELSLATSLFNT